MSVSFDAAEMFKKGETVSARHAAVSDLAILFFIFFPPVCNASTKHRRELVRNNVSTDRRGMVSSTRSLEQVVKARHLTVCGIAVFKRFCFDTVIIVPYFFDIIKLVIDIFYRSSVCVIDGVKLAVVRIVFVVNDFISADRYRIGVSKSIIEEFILGGSCPAVF